MNLRRDDLRRMAAWTTGVAWLTATAGLSGCRAESQPQTTAPVYPPVNVQTTAPERREIAKLLTLTADVMPIQEATLYAKTAGYLKIITKDKGDTVRRGELIAIIDSPELKNESAQYADNTRSLASSLEASRVGHARALEETREADAAVKRSESETEDARRAVARAEAVIRMAEAAQAKAQADLVPPRAALAKSQQDLKRAEATARESVEDLRAAQAALDQAQSEHKLAKLTHDRLRQVQAKDGGLIASQLVDDAESKMVTAQGKVAGAQGKLAALRHRAEATQSEVESAKQQIEVVRGQLDSAHRQLDIARSNVELARADREVMEGKTNTSKQQIEVARRRAAVLARQAEVVKAQSNAAQSTVSSARNAQARAASLAEYTEIRAPFDGIVTRRFVDVGALIPTGASSPASRPIVQIMDVRKVRVHAHVPESHAAAIKVGMAVELLHDALAKDKFTGVVARTSSALDPGTHTLLAEIVLANHGSKLLPGMFVRVKFRLDQHQNALVVPLEAVLAEKSGKSVFIVTGNKAKKLPVQVGFEDGAGVEILEGLQGDEQVVVVNKEQLQPDAVVNARAWIPPAKS